MLIVVNVDFGQPSLKKKNTAINVTVMDHSHLLSKT